VAPPIRSQIGVAVVSGVLLDHVDHDPAQRDVGGSALARRHAVEVVGVEDPVAASAGDPPRSERLVDGIGRHEVEVAVRALVGALQHRRVLAPATCPSNQLRATSVLWHTSPISDIVDGGAERAQSCSGVNPSHFICNVAR
jgi:hypothetical protein